MRADLTPGDSAAGFTLIEVLAVLVIMGLALAIFATQGTTRHPAMDLHAGVSSLVEGLRMARARAVAADRPTAFVIDVGAHAYRVGDSAARSLAPDLAITVTTVGGAVRGQSAAIGFLPDGSCTGGRIELAAAQHHAAINVDWLTGRTSVVDAD